MPGQTEVWITVFASRSDRTDRPSALSLLLDRLDRTEAPEVADGITVVRSSAAPELTVESPAEPARPVGTAEAPAAGIAEAPVEAPAEPAEHTEPVDPAAPPEHSGRRALRGRVTGLSALSRQLLARGGASGAAVSRRVRRGMRFPGARFAVQAVLLFAVVAGTIGYVALGKTITLTVDGQSRQVGVFGGTVSSLLSSEHLRVGARDLVAPSPSSKLHDGERVVVRFARHHLSEPASLPALDFWERRPWSATS